PWSHAFPHDPYPKPAMEWRFEAVRWFDQWLRERDTGILKEPKFAVFVRRWHPPGPYLEEAPGQWVWEAGWPINHIKEQLFYFQPDHTLSESVPQSETHQLRNVPSTGIEASGPVMWWGDVAPDQRLTDAFSLIYDSLPMSHEIEMLGLPKAILQVSANAPHANWFVRISDVAPDGTVTQVAGAGFNGTHRNSPKNPQSLTPGELFPLEVELHFTSWTFQKGHRIRVAINNSQWPMFWPSPYPVTTSLVLGSKSKMLLPIVPKMDRKQPSFLIPAKNPVLPGFKSLDEGTTSGYGEIGTIERDPSKQITKVIATNSSGTQYPWGIERFDERIVHETNDEHPENTSVIGEHKFEVQLKDRTLTWQGSLLFRSDQKNFYYTYTRKLLKDGKLIREKNWKDTIPRDFQ
ncbi:MAG TPA: CocE/NonD family hydrolase, partial [Acidobacteriota bacterium]|nr:CocE/NonD family hydrolase [Acidobacteriota bacterium]